LASSERGSSRILIIDDNETNRALARSTLEDEGYAVALAAGGAQGLLEFQKAQPDCVILDVRMPDMDGFEVCARLRALPGGPETPILFFTALRDVDTFDRAAQAGGDDFLTKPILPTELLVRVQSALKIRRLGAELREHYDQLKKNRDDLLRLTLQRERMTAFLVHDLKNPVNSMDLNAQLILRNKELPGRDRDAVVRIRADAQQLNRMILNLLDIAKAEEGRLAAKRTSLDLRALVGDVVAENTASAESRGVVIRIALETPEVFADGELLRRTLTNLVENAIRHAPRGTEVSVSARKVLAAAEVRVADTGRGIPVALRDRVFEPFVQAAGSRGSENQRGRGLGLTFCKLAVEAHGGAIWVEDAAPGAVFCVRLPDGP
jgi:two-component system sensor histidine kinase/response regulator